MDGFAAVFVGAVLVAVPDPAGAFVVGSGAGGTVIGATNSGASARRLMR